MGAYKSYAISETENTSRIVVRLPQQRRRVQLPRVVEKLERQIARKLRNVLTVVCLGTGRMTSAARRKVQAL